jgi:hypothetical protein
MLKPDGEVGKHISYHNILCPSSIDITFDFLIVFPTLIVEDSCFITCKFQMMIFNIREDVEKGQKVFC